MEFTGHQIHVGMLTQKIIFLVHNHMLCVLKRTDSMLWFFWAPKTCLNWVKDKKIYAILRTKTLLIWTNDLHMEYEINKSLISTHRFRLNKIFQRKIVKNFIPIFFSICFECSKEPSHWDGSFEYPQHMFWLINKKIVFVICTQYIYISKSSFGFNINGKGLNVTWYPDGIRYMCFIHVN